MTDLAEPDNLFSPTITGHCFWWPRCKHTVTCTPESAHAEMEQHYADAHADDLRAPTWMEWRSR